MQRELENATDKTKRLSQIELEAQQQAEYEARMRKEMEDKKKERLGKQNTCKQEYAYIHMKNRKIWWHFKL